VVGDGFLMVSAGLIISGNNFQNLFSECTDNVLRSKLKKTETSDFVLEFSVELAERKHNTLKTI